MCAWSLMQMKWTMDDFAVFRLHRCTVLWRGTVLRHSESSTRNFSATCARVARHTIAQKRRRRRCALFSCGVVLIVVKVRKYRNCSDYVSTITFHNRPPSSFAAICKVSRYFCTCFVRSCVRGHCLNVLFVSSRFFPCVEAGELRRRGTAVLQLEDAENSDVRLWIIYASSK